MTIYLEKDYSVVTYYTDKAIEAMEITKEQWSKLRSVPKFYNWKYNPNTDGFELSPKLDLETLRNRREEECFNLLASRCQLWWNRLTSAEKQELEEWYQNWLDVTLTLKIPETPKWI